MSREKVNIPAGMLVAAREAHRKFEADEPGVFLTARILEAALLWLAENPISPTIKQAADLLFVFRDVPSDLDRIREIALRWQRRMLLAPDPEPNDILDGFIRFAEQMEAAGVHNFAEFQERLRKIKAGQHKSA